MAAAMLDWLPRIAYPAEREGYWSPVTSTINWCEEDYYATIYSAEIVNAGTNLAFLYLAFRGLRSCLVHGHDTIFLISFLGYLSVGTGSFLFHSTLKYPMQLVDELSMIYTTCIMFHASFVARGASRAYSAALGLALAALAATITLVYHYLKDPAFHQNAYALLTAVVLLRSMWVMEARIRPARRAAKAPSAAGSAAKAAGGAAELVAAEDEDVAQEAERRRVDARDAAVLALMWRLIAVGLSVFLGGFAIWWLDNRYCSTLRRWRHAVGLPWGVVLEGHGWWHLMTGLGAYFYIVWGIWLRHCLEGRGDEYELVWPSVWTSVPEVVRRSTKPGGSSSSSSSSEKKDVKEEHDANANGNPKANDRVKAD